MVRVLDDYADSYGEGYDDGFNDGWSSCDYENECGYNDEAHYDPFYEGYLQGVKENVTSDTASDESAVAVLKGIADIIKSNSEMSTPMHYRFLVSVEEASKLYGIGVKTLYRMIRNNPEADFILEVGSHYKIKRELFEEFLKYTTNLD